MIGTTLDKYEVLQKLGEGGMATVYRGRHTTLNRDVAIKVLHPHLSSSLRNRKRFAREARAIEHLRHANILEIFDYSGTDCSDCYIITEFVDGQTLSSLMSGLGPLPSEVAAILGIELAQALEYAHNAGILHRDLKPDNVMLRIDGTVKLMDFGIARFLDESQVTMTGALVGSPAFMSPEQAREGDLDPRSDLFSLGTLLFYLVTGHLPFSGSNPSLILKNIIEGNRPAVSELAPTMSASLADLIERLLQLERDERPASARDVIEDLRATLDETGVLPEDPRWVVTAFVEDPDAYSARLDDHLRHTLFERGKALLATGDHLSALRLFNRLLSIDEDNEEVLSLVQGLHTEKQRRPATRFVALLGTGLFVVVALLSWQATLDPEPVSAPEPPVAVAEVAPPAPTSPTDLVQGPEPEPDPETARPSPEEARRPLRARVMVPPTPLAPRITHAGSPVDDPPTPEPEPAFATAEFRVQKYWAEIYEDGRLIGNTRQRDPIEISPGQHTVVLRSQVMEDYPIEFTVAPGERFVQKDITMHPKPAVVIFDEAFEASCTVRRDNERLGTLGELARRASLPRPDQAHMLIVECGDRVYPRRFSNLLDPVVAFPREERE